MFRNLINVLSEHPLPTVLLFTAILVIIVTLLARVFLPSGKHRMTPDPVPDGIDPDWGDDDDDTDDDDWAYELRDMKRDRIATAVTKALAPVTETFGYERLAAPEEADTFIRELHRQDTIIDPYAPDWFTRSYDLLLSWATDETDYQAYWRADMDHEARQWDMAIAA